MPCMQVKIHINSSFLWLFLPGLCISKLNEKEPNSQSLKINCSCNRWPYQNRFLDRSKITQGWCNSLSHISVSK